MAAAELVVQGDGRSRDQDVIFGPMMNMVRVPQAGRNFETLGEDPSLMAALVAAETRGIQSQGEIATAKHFAENNQENNRMGVNVNVDDQTLREMELRGFEAAVKDGHSGAVMCAYNGVNGDFSCENPTLLTDILRNQWGFSGFVVSDYGANHSAGPALEAGMDIEFFGTHFLQLKSLIQSGAVPVSALDNAVRSILTTMDRFGLLVHASPTGGTVVNRPLPPFPELADAQQARTIAEQGAVLLRNQGGTLPLTPADLRLAGGDRDDRPHAAGGRRRQLPGPGCDRPRDQPVGCAAASGRPAGEHHLRGGPGRAGRGGAQRRVGSAECGTEPARCAADEHGDRRHPD